MGFHKFKWFKDYFQNESTNGVDFGNVEVKTLTKMYCRNRLYYRTEIGQKDLKAEYILIFHIDFEIYYLLRNKDLLKLKIGCGNSILETQIDRVCFKVFETTDEMLNYIKKIINPKYLK